MLNVITTHARVDDALVRDWVMAMVRNADALGDTLALYKGLADLFEELKSEGTSVFEPGGVKLHPAAKLAYEEAGLLS